MQNVHSKNYNESISSRIKPVTCIINLTSTPSAFILRAFSIRSFKTPCSIPSSLPIAKPASRPFISPSNHDVLIELSRTRLSSRPLWGQACIVALLIHSSTMASISTNHAKLITTRNNTLPNIKTNPAMQRVHSFEENPPSSQHPHPYFCFTDDYKRTR